jgi:protein-L-isoaspartate O-methyltransferase
MTAAEVKAAQEQGRAHERADKTGFMLSEAPSAAEADQEQAEPMTANANAEDVSDQSAVKAGDIDALRAQLRAGIQVVSVPQLFPTPAHVAAEMVELAEIEIGERVLDPEAGTAAILKALPGVVPFGAVKQTAVEVVAVEINHALAKALETSGYANKVVCADFLECGDELGKYDVILMNPPFARAIDIEHIKHARKFLNPKGRLVAVCADGPRQNEQLRPIAEGSGGMWKVLPPGTFKEEGTMVNSALMLIRA